VDHWGHYLKAKPFVLYSDHEALSYINGQHKLTQDMPGRLSSPSPICIKVGKRILWSVIKAKVLGIHSIKGIYHGDEDFKEVVENLSNFGSFTLQDGFLFKVSKLCILKSPLRDLIVKEAHGGALVDHLELTRPLTYSRSILIGTRWMGLFIR